MRSLVFALCLPFALLSSARASPTWLDLDFGCYLKDMLALTGVDYGFRGTERSTQLGNVIHARENLRWYPLGNLTFALEVKTRHFIGENIRSTVEYSEGLASQATYFDWSWTLAEGDNVSLITAIDRAYVDCYLGPTQITLGRQRIAWGTNWVWNPIDLFNPVSPLDLDVEERPGSDAARVQYYAGPTSKLELATAPGRESWRNVAAGLVKINRWEYDFHLIGGWKRSSGVVGGAWAGQVKGAGLRGEWLYAHPSGGGEYAEPFALAAISADYTFPNSFYLHAEALYNSEGNTEEAGGQRLQLAIERGELSPARASFFGEVGCNFSPLVRGRLSGILNPFDNSWFLGPNVYWSLASNTDLLAAALIFGGERGTEFGDMSAVLSASLKFSF